MSGLTEVKTDRDHYYKDSNGRRQGEYKTWYENGELRKHCFYIDDKPHKEYKIWYDDGQLQGHCFFVDGKCHGEYKFWDDEGQILEHSFYTAAKDITDEVVALVRDINCITAEERLILKLRFGIICSPESNDG